MEFLRSLGLAEVEDEYFLVLHLHAKDAVKSYSLVSLGTAGRTQVNSREVIRSAISQGTTRIVVAHNHPSGDCTPTAKDIESTRRLIRLGKKAGIEILDHVIIGHQTACFDRSYTSFREQNLL